MNTPVTTHDKPQAKNQSQTPVETGINSQVQKKSVAEVLDLMNAPSIDERSLRQYVIEDPQASDAFAPVLKFNPETVDIASLDGMARPRGSAFLKVFNKAASTRRQRRFLTKISDGYEGPVIVSEGDSWFQYPLLLDDVIDCLSDRYAVFSLGAAADTLQGMIRQDEYVPAIEDTHADIFLLSGGGNDLFGNRRLAQYVRDFDAGLAANQYILPAFSGFLNDVMSQYQQIIQRVRRNTPHVQILCHAYDQAVPNGQKWLGKPLNERGIRDHALQSTITREIFERFSTALQTLVQRHENVHFVNSSGVVDRRWHDELHPTDAGFKDVARVFSQSIETLVSTGQLDRARSPVVDTSSTTRSDENEAVESTPAMDSGSVASPAIVSAAAKGYSLHIGVNRFDPAHYGSDGELLSCEFDAEAMQSIAASQGYTDPILLKTTDATRESVIDSLHSLSARMTAKDICFISYAGHGSQIRDLNLDEIDGTDETWCLYDAQLVDDELYDLWAGFPAGSRVLVISDSCHSGSVVRAGANGTTERVEAMPETVSSVQSRPRALPARQSTRIYMQHRQFYDSRLSGASSREAQADLPVSVRLLSGCQDNQESLDGPFNGAFTTQLLRAWNQGEFERDYAHFVGEICRNMPNTQTPNHFTTGIRNALYDRQSPFEL